MAPFCLFSSFNIGNSTFNFCFSIFRGRKLTTLQGSPHFFFYISPLVRNYSSCQWIEVPHLVPLPIGSSNSPEFPQSKFFKYFQALPISPLSCRHCCCLTRYSMSVPSTLPSVRLPHPGSLSQVCQCSLPRGSRK